jgi:hypothetical protein
MFIHTHTHTHTSKIFIHIYNWRYVLKTFQTYSMLVYSINRLVSSISSISKLVNELILLNELIAKVYTKILVIKSFSNQPP